VERPVRKEIRLPDYDYSQPGCYFVTICTAIRNRNILCSIDSVGGGLCAAPHVALTGIGQIVEESIEKIHILNPGVDVDIYSIMPDHLHLVLNLTGRHGGRPLQEIIGRFKSYTDHYYRTHSPAFGPKLWQRGYYDHIIRNNDDLEPSRQYIQNNPLSWILNKD
jgi:REP element-mobilizing transposase RayT